MNRQLSPSFPYAAIATTWSDYDGDVVYGDFTVSGTTVSNVRSFAPGMARTENPLSAPVTNYYHGDMLGTTRLMTTNPPPPGTPTAIEPAVYTAFGERIFPPTTTDATRYGYAGAWGYQSTPIPESPTPDPFPFLHVGARYYDPSSGRFLQRDPIGILGGTNVFAYARFSPTVGIDPSGLFSVEEGVVGGIIGVVGGALTGGLPGAVVGGVGGFIGGGYEEGDAKDFLEWLLPDEFPFCDPYFGKCEPGQTPFPACGGHRW